MFTLFSFSFAILTLRLVWLPRVYISSWVVYDIGLQFGRGFSVEDLENFNRVSAKAQHSFEGDFSNQIHISSVQTIVWTIGQTIVQAIVQSVIQTIVQTVVQTIIQTIV